MNELMYSVPSENTLTKQEEVILMDQAASLQPII